MDSVRSNECVGDYRSSSGLTLHVVRQRGDLFSMFDDWPIRFVPHAHWRKRTLHEAAEFVTIGLTRTKNGQVDELAVRWGGEGEPMRFVRARKFTPPPGEETEAVAKLIDIAAADLCLREPPLDILSILRFCPVTSGRDFVN